MNGQFVFAQVDGSLLAAPFDARRLVVGNDVRPILDSIQTSSTFAALQGTDAVVARNGTILAVRRSTGALGLSARLVRVDRLGQRRAAVASSPILLPSPLGGLDVAPDGRRVAIALADSASGRSDIYVVDLPTGARNRLTFDGRNNSRPRWSPDGRRVLYVSDAHEGDLHLFERAADGTGAAQRLPGGPGAWGGQQSPDGRWLVVRTDAVSATSRDIVAYRTTGDTGRVIIAGALAAELSPDISPDSRWIAYSSDENGVDQIFVQPFPYAAGSRWQVSSGPGFAPRWSRDGRSLYYQTPRGQVMVADVATSPQFRVLGERALFADFALAAYVYYQTYAVDHDDRHFLMLALSDQDSRAGARLLELEGWLAAPRRR